MPTKSSGRPARKPEETREKLSRERVIQTAIALANREGLERLTLRRLATELGVGTMSLYTYTADKAALLDSMTEALVAELVASTPSDDWREILLESARALRRFYREHPRLLPLLLRPMSSVASLSVFERAIGKMMEDGFSAEQGLYGFRAVAGFAIGYLLLESTFFGGEGGSPADRHRLVEAQFQRLPEGTYPILRSLVSTMASPNPERDFEFGLRVLITGLEQERREGASARKGAPSMSHGS